MATLRDMRAEIADLAAKVEEVDSQAADMVRQYHQMAQEKRLPIKTCAMYAIFASTEAARCGVDIPPDTLKSRQRRWRRCATNDAERSQR